jgi:GTP-binding protein
MTELDGTWAEESEWTAVDEEFGHPDDTEAEPPPPVLAVVGRPNVGKSTMVNRILGRREAVVQDKPGVTRDRVAYDALWNGRRFTVVDTGGWDPKADGLQASVTAQAELAMRTADAVLLVVDASVGPTRRPPGCSAAPTSRCCWPRTRSTTTASWPTWRRCGHWAWGSRSR